MALNALRGQIFVTPPLPTTSFAGKTIIVTGANIGLGLEASKHLVRLGVSRLILACRSIEKGEAARRTILNEHPQATTTIEVWTLDLARYVSVLAFAERCNTLERLDGIVENAGLSTTEFVLAEENESTITVNVVSTLLLAILLLRKLRESAARFGVMPHIAFVGSMVHMFAKTKDLTAPAQGKILSTLNNPKKARMADRYNLSKLLLILCIREFAAKLNEAEKEHGHRLVVANNVAPGWVKTELFRTDYETWSAPQKLMYKTIARSAEEGSRTLIHGVSAGKQSHGEYLTECTVQPASAWVRCGDGRRIQKSLWDEVMAKLDGISPGVSGLI